MKNPCQTMYMIYNCYSFFTFVVSLQEEGNCQAFPIFLSYNTIKIKSEAAINCALELLFFYLWQGSQVTVTKRLREYGIT